MTISILTTGAANLASVRAAFGRLGAETELVDDPGRVLDADRVVLPGVGAFGPAAQGLAARGLDVAIKERIENGRPLLAICLGLQLLFEGSEESPDIPGLGVFPGTVGRFDPSVTSPQMGWSRVSGAGSIEPGWAYYANSFRATAVPNDADVALSDHGGPFIAAIQRGSLLGCQFHPELSGAWGSDLLRRWMEAPCLPAA
jgi:imidazole glycerol-phosphate synthase subunit HisH